MRSKSGWERVADTHAWKKSKGGSKKGSGPKSSFSRGAVCVVNADPHGVTFLFFRIKKTRAPAPTPGEQRCSPGTDHAGPKAQAPPSPPESKRSNETRSPRKLSIGTRACTVASGGGESAMVPSDRCACRGARCHKPYAEKTCSLLG